MQLIHHINNRDIYYLSVRADEQWYRKIPSSDWILVFIAPQMPVEDLFSHIRWCNTSGVSYICCLGDNPNFVEDCFDEDIVELAVNWEISTGRTYDYSTNPPTVSFADFAEGIWFVVFNACIDPPQCKTIVCLDLNETPVLSLIEQTLLAISR